MSPYRKYLWAFVITALIFVGITLVSNYFDNQRVSEIRSIQDSISMNILSSETQFDLLKETPCDDLGNSSLSQELDTLGEQVSYLESARGSGDAQVISLKQEYALLEIKDFILMQNMTEKCGLKPVFVLYFYSNAGDCPDCSDMGAVLTALRQDYPEVRVYSFDYNGSVSAVKTLESIYGVKDRLPALVVHNKPVYGLKPLADVEKLMPELATMASSTAATSTGNSSGK
ncbi:MAG: thioredoxin family protein [Patescibacteria group bacterium]|nr:thioredoxin family protein [Patescibacteria group bacterium]